MRMTGVRNASVLMVAAFLTSTQRFLLRWRDQTLHLFTLPLANLPDLLPLLSG